jgi:hypothetical protein
MKSKAISVILSMILAGSLGVGQNITIIEDHTTEDHTIAEDREAGCVTIEALFLGDICLGTGFGSKHRFQDVYNEKGAEYFFSGVREEFRDKDLIVANLENVFTDNKDYQKGKIYTYRADPKYIDIIKKSGITYFGVVNNHMGDYLQSGFDDSIKNLAALPSSSKMVSSLSPNISSVLIVGMTHHSVIFDPIIKAITGNINKNNKTIIILVFFRFFRIPILGLFKIIPPDIVNQHSIYNHTYYIYSLFRLNGRALFANTCLNIYIVKL